MKNVLLVLVCGSTFLAAAAATAGPAQPNTDGTQPTNQPQPSGGNVALTEVVVTARKVRESIQTAPVAVTAFNSEQLTERQILQPQDLQQSVPSILVTGGASTAAGRNLANYNVRGLTVGNAIYLNGAPEMPIGGGANGSAGFPQQYFYDLSSVQVVAGPQGTLFGRTSAGGAVLYETERPTNAFDADIDLSLGNLNLRRVKAMVNVPVVADVLSVRFAAFLVRREGYTTSLTTGQRLDDQHREGFRLGIDFKPVQSFDSYTMFQYDNIAEDGAGNVLVDFNPNFELGGSLPIYNLPAYFATFGPAAPFVQSAVESALFGGPCTADAARYGFTAANNSPFLAGCENQRLGILNQLGTTLAAEAANVDRRQTYTTALDAANLRTYQLLNNSELDLGGTGFVTKGRLKNIVSYTWQAAEFPGYTDFGGSALPLLVLQPGGRIPEVLGSCVTSGPDIGTCSYPTQPRSAPQNTPTQLSEELDGSATLGGKLDLLAGLFYLDYKQGAVPSDLTSAFGNVLFEGLAPPPALEASTRAYEKAAFVNGTLDLSDWVLHGLSVSAGYRRTRTTSELGEQLVAGGPLVGTENSSEEVGNRTFTVDWQLNPKTLLYARSGTGYQPGGPNSSCILNGAPPGCPSSYAPETDTDYELGTKIDWALGGLRLRSDAAVYQTNFDNIQTGEEAVLASGAAAVYTTNAAKARIRGIELTQTAVYGRLSLTGTYSLIDAKYLKWFGNGPGKICTDPLNNSAGNCYDFSNSPFAGAPRNEASLLASLDLPTPESWGAIIPSFQVSYRGPVSYGRNQILDPYSGAGGYTLANANIEWSDMFGLPLDVTLFGRNIFNKIYDTVIEPLYNNTLFGINTEEFGEPANYGIELRYRFGASANR